MNKSKNSDIRRVAIYGRVSTEHEAQLSAFENQQQWYEDVAKHHDDWQIVARFYDEGITGTAATKRPQFMKMIEQARDGKFDLVVTREVCRFARNTLDSLLYTRELKEKGIEVYFINDNLWTFAEDSELRLSIFASLAQDESRKISERVRAGQEISRKNHVLYGNGNILGYDRVGNTYVINEEQAEAVRKVFELYHKGMGCKKICGEMMTLGFKTASGDTSWNVSNVNRIIRNATYKGYIGYNKSESPNFLTQKRVNKKQSEYIYVKGDFEPIISEELWDECQRLRASRRIKIKDNNGNPKEIPQKTERPVWVKKLRCSCGSSFQRFKWYSHQSREGVNYGYGCNRQSRSASRSTLIKHGLDASIACERKCIPGWQLDMMAVHVFRKVFEERKDAVLLACKMITECYTAETGSFEDSIAADNKQIDKLMKRQVGLRSMCADGLITKQQFIRDNEEIENEIQNLRLRIHKTEEAADNSAKNGKLDMKYIRKVLDSWTACEGTVIPDSLIEQFVLQVVVETDTTFNWTIDMSNGETETMTAAEIALQLYRDKQKKKRLEENAMDEYIDTVLDNHILDPKELFRFIITTKDAREYCKEINHKFFEKKWSDKTIIISI